MVTARHAAAEARAARRANPSEETEAAYRAVLADRDAATATLVALVEDDVWAAVENA